MTPVSQLVDRSVRCNVKKLVKSQAFRVLLALWTLAGSALVLEAGRRWH